MCELVKMKGIFVFNMSIFNIQKNDPQKMYCFVLYFNLKLQISTFILKSRPFSLYVLESVNKQLKIGINKCINT